MKTKNEYVPLNRPDFSAVDPSSSSLNFIDDLRRMAEMVI
jgi:hypothetical protein